MKNNDVSVNIIEDTAILLNRITLLTEVGGNCSATAKHTNL